MPWFKVDDQLAFHPKAIVAGNAALGLWVRAGSWCAAHVTQGALPAHMLRTLGAQRRDAEKLVTAGLWMRTEDGYLFKDWDDYQPTKEQVEAKRVATRERVRAHRERHGNAVTDSVTNGVTNGVSNDPPSRPVPSSPHTPQEGEDRPDRFDEFWAAYPRKTAKVSALKAWTKALKSTDPQVILDGLARFRFSDDLQYVPHPATWLNSGRWADEPVTAGSNGHGYVPPSKRLPTAWTS